MGVPWYDGSNGSQPVTTIKLPIRKLVHGSNTLLKYDE